MSASKSFKLLSHINSYLITNQIIGRRSVGRILKQYHGNDWRRCNGNIFKTKDFEINVKYWAMGESTPYKRDDISIYKVLQGSVDLKLSPHESIYPLGLNDVFLSQSLYKIKNADANTVTLQIKFNLDCYSKSISTLFKV